MLRRQHRISQDNATQLINFKQCQAYSPPFLPKTRTCRMTPCQGRMLFAYRRKYLLFRSSMTGAFFHLELCFPLALACYKDFLVPKILIVRIIIVAYFVMQTIPQLELSKFFDGSTMCGLFDRIFLCYCTEFKALIDESANLKEI